MNYEKSDWGYAGKLFGSCMAALGLAAGLALFMPNKPARAESLEKIVKKDDIKVTTALPKLGVHASDYINEPVEEDESETYENVPASSALKQEALLRLQNGQYKLTDRFDLPELKLKVIYGEINVLGKEYSFTNSENSFMLFDEKKRKKYDVFSRKDK